MAPNLILLFQFTRSWASDLKRDQIGDVDRVANTTEIRFFNFGPGVAYYFDALGLYLSGAVMLAWMNQSDEGTSKVSEPDQITDKGFGTSLMIGKEWWVSGDWGVSMASMFQLASMKSREVDARWLTTSLSFLLSVTFN